MPIFRKGKNPKDTSLKEGLVDSDHLRPAKEEKGVKLDESDKEVREAMRAAEIARRVSNPEKARAEAKRSKLIQNVSGNEQQKEKMQTAPTPIPEHLKEKLVREEDSLTPQVTTTRRFTMFRGDPLEQAKEKLKKKDDYSPPEVPPSIKR